MADKKTQALENIVAYPAAVFEIDGLQYVRLSHFLAVRQMAQEGLRKQARA